MRRHLPSSLTLSGDAKLLQGAPFLGRYLPTAEGKVFRKDDGKFFLYFHPKTRRWVVGANRLGEGWLYNDSPAESPLGLGGWTHWDPELERWRTDGAVTVTGGYGPSEYNPGKRQRTKTALEIEREVDDLLGDDFGSTNPSSSEAQTSESKTVTAEPTVPSSEPKEGVSSENSLEQQLQQLDAILRDNPNNEEIKLLRRQVVALIEEKKNEGMSSTSTPTPSWLSVNNRCFVKWSDGRKYPVRVESVSAESSKASVYFLQYGFNDTVEVDTDALSPFSGVDRSELKTKMPIWAFWADDNIMYKAKIKQILYGGCLVEFEEFEGEYEVSFSDVTMRDIDPTEAATPTLGEDRKKGGEGRKKRRTTLKCGSHSVEGYNRADPTKVNQDCRIEVPELSNEPNASLFGVLDGHGSNGHNISSHASKKIIEGIQKERNRLRRSPGKHLSVVIDNVVAQLRSVQAAIKSGASRRGVELEASSSGTTACISLKYKNRLITANIGDSRGVLCRVCRGNPVDGGKISAVYGKYVKVRGLVLEVIPLSKDHKPDDPKEKNRILKAGGKVLSLGPGQPYWVFGPSGLGLAVSRSIGDFKLHPCVIAEPDIKEHIIEKDDIFAIWASDGVWEHLGNSEVIRVIAESEALTDKGSLDAVSQTLCNRARELWRATSEGSYQDDITCVIAQFNRLPTSRRILARMSSDGVASTSTEVL